MGADDKSEVDGVGGDDGGEHGSADVLGGDTGDDNGKSDALDPADGIPTIKRGRHPDGCDCLRCVNKRNTGSNTGRNTSRTSGRTKKEKGVDLDNFALQVAGLHKLLAMVSKTPCLEIGKDESEKLAVAIKGVLNEYDLKPSPKAMAWSQLLAVSVAVYSPRIALLVLQAKANKEAKKNATPFPTPETPQTQPGTIRFS